MDSGSHCIPRCKPSAGRSLPNAGIPSAASTLGGVGNSGFSDLDGMFDDIQRQAVDDAHELFAQDVAATARENGLATADEIDIDIESRPAEPGWEIDPERVRRRANEIPAAG